MKWRDGAPQTWDSAKEVRKPLTVTIRTGGDASGHAGQRTPHDEMPGPVMAEPPFCTPHLCRHCFVLYIQDLDTLRQTA